MPPGASPGRTTSRPLAEAPPQALHYLPVTTFLPVIRPGLTGLWQVSGRSDLSWEETVRLDLYYVDNWSMLQDVNILLKTLRAVTRSDGAY